MSGVGPSTRASAEATCPAGKVAIAGGYNALNNGPFVHVLVNQPLGLPHAGSWAVTVFNDNPTSDIRFQAFAICVFVS